MAWQREIKLPSFPRGVHLVTHFIENELRGIDVSGVLHIFIKHTSAGLCLNENADPSVRFDLNNFFDELVPESAPYFTHVFEGADDMPAHIKNILAGSSVSVPVTGGRMNLGTWQGIYLCEFRNHGGPRKLVLTI